MADNLSSQREVFENIIESTFNNIVLLDAGGLFLYTSPSFCKEFRGNFNCESCVSIFDVIHTDDIEKFKIEFIKAVKSEPKTYKAVVEFRIKSISGDYRYVETIISNLLEHDSFNAMVLSFRDVTAYKNSLKELEVYKTQLENLVQQRTQELRKSIDKEKEVIEQQKRFISMVSHEFRTPLTIIDGNAQIIVNRGDKLTREMLQGRSMAIRKAVDRLVGLIERVLSDRVMEKGDLQLTLVPCDLSAMVRDVCIEKLGIAPQAKIQLDVERGIPMLLLDDKLIHQSVTNLISNAFKYSDEDPEIRVRVYTEDDNVVVSVKDKGIGIPENEIGKIFNKYYRASTAAGIPGTGLGLNLVKEIAGLHGGDAFIESEVGMGTTITIKIPMKVAENNDIVKEEA